MEDSDLEKDTLTQISPENLYKKYCRPANTWEMNTVMINSPKEDLALESISEKVAILNRVIEVGKIYDKKDRECKPY